MITSGTKQDGNRQKTFNENGARAARFLCSLSVGIEISGDFLPVILNAIKNMGEQNFFAWKKRENGND